MRALPSRRARLARSLLGGFLVAAAPTPCESQFATAPPLPALALEAYPPRARAQLAAADERAARRPDDPLAVGTLGQVLQAWEQWEAAHRAYTRAHYLAPRTFTWPYLDGVVLLRLGRAAEAAERFRKSVALAPGYLPARVKLAETLFDIGESDASRREYESLRGEPSAAPHVALGAGRLAARAGRHDDAVTHFRRALALYPEFGAAHYGLAMSLRSLGRRDEAAASMARQREYATRWPAIEDPVIAEVNGLRHDARRHLDRGLDLARQGDVTGAIAEHEVAVSIEPALAQAHANLILLHARAGTWDRAEEHYRALLALGQNADEAHYNYAVALGLQGRTAEAAAAYARALEANPAHALACNNLGQLFERTHQYQQAEAQYRRAVAIQPTLRIARFNLGRMLVASGHLREAIAELERAIEPLDAETPRYLFGLAAAHVRAGHLEKGRAMAADALRQARERGQTELAAAIERDLESLRR